MAMALQPACKVSDPLYCDRSTPCDDPARPFCDLTGEYPASDGVARTCIPLPFDAGTVSSGEDSGTIDGDAAPPGDARPPCSWLPLLQLELPNTPTGGSSPSLDADGLTLYFSRIVESRSRIYVATRAAVGKPFGEPTLMEDLSSDDVSHDQPEISASTLEAFFRVPSGNTIETATRSSPAKDFGPSMPSGFNGFSPSLSGDGRALYFASGGADPSVQRATRSSVSAPWSEPVSVLPTRGYLGVDVTPDELALLLVRNPFEAPQQPILVARRSSRDQEFGPAVPVNDELLIPDAVYGKATWDRTQTQMIVSLQPEGGATDLYYSVCQ